MKKLFLVLGILIPFSCMMSSCRSCVKKAAEKTTELALSAVDGVAEALDKHGEETGRKVTDALGKVAAGSLTSIGELLDEHADTVARAAGRTLVQTLDGLDEGITESYYTPIAYTADFPAGAVLDHIGRIDGKDVIDAWFVFPEEGRYDITFSYRDAAGNTLFEHTAKASRTAGDEGRCTVVSYALNPPEAELFGHAVTVAIQVKKAA